MLVNILKRSLLTAVAVGSASCFLIAGGSIYAASSTPGSSTKSSARAAALAQTQQTDLANLKTKGTAEINRRIASLNSVAGKISQTSKLSSSDQSYLSNEVSTELNGLTSLKNTLNGETTLSAARSDVQSIFNDYRVYALILPKVWLVTTADGEQNTSTKLTTLSTQLQAKITADQQAGKDVTTLQNELSGMETSTKNAQTIASTIENNVLALQPTNYDSDHTILSGDLAQLKTAHADNKTAYSYAQSTVSGLKNL